MLIVTLSTLSLLGATALTGIMDRFPRQQAAMERCSGIMLVAGLALIGGSLPLFR